VRPHPALVLVLAAVSAVVGCSHTRKDHSQRTAVAAATSSATSQPSSTSAAPPSSSAPGPVQSATTAQSAPALVVELVAAVTSQEEQAFPAPVLGLALRLAASGGPVDVSRLEVASAGRMDESRLGAARLFADANGDGEVDSSDVLLATAPAAAADDAPYVFSLATSLTLMPGAPRALLVTVDTATVGSSATVAFVGSTLELSIAGATSVRADAAGAPITASGTFPLSRRTVLEVNDTVLITEVASGFGSNGASSEFVELWNATGKTVDLSTYYLTDFTDRQTTGRYYWKLPTGQDFYVADGDFFVKFPRGTLLAPGQLIVVGVDAGGFEATYHVAPDFALRNTNHARTTAVQLLSWDGVVGGVRFVPTPVGDSVSIKGPGPAPFDPSGEGESVFLLRWDGTSDLVQDVDIVNYGTSTSTNMSIDKSPNQRAPGPDVRVDSAFDADTLPSQFEPDLDELHQEAQRAPLGPTTERVDFTEGHEKKTGGNGLTGNDETSEDLGVYDLTTGKLRPGTFRASTAPTPGRLP
jgi:hypothetical protein